MEQLSKIQVIVGMSGGVDSSVAALILLLQGYQVKGLFMKNWEEDDGSEYCTAIQDLADAQNVCDTLGIELHRANFAAEYWDNVFAHFLHEYKSGRTPNPDILCNKEIKFKAFLDYAKILGADYIATGHYAQKKRRGDSTLLCKGADINKDQSYFLHAVGQDKLARTLFPIGELEKPDVRKLAEKHNLITHNKKDSTGICFIGERRFKDFLQKYIPAQPGAIETTEGEVVGEHSGLMYHTIGQRQGLGIGGLKQAKNEPWYVVEKILKPNILIIAQGNNHPLLFSNALTASSVDWVTGLPPNIPCHLMAKVRYRQEDQRCHLSMKEDGSYWIQFETPQRAVTPGQYIVFYQGNICLGGGVIEEKFL